MRYLRSSVVEELDHPDEILQAAGVFFYFRHYDINKTDSGGAIMNDGFVFQWPMLLAVIITLFYFEVMRWLDKYWANRTPLTDEERLWNHARNQGISEHEVFKRAAATWSLSAEKSDADFNTYLKNDILPHYVRDYLRKLKTL